MKALRSLAILLSITAIGSLLLLFARRLIYPYDLEWMEGGMLCHALRIVRGLPIYAPPSVDFVPYLYTALYPAVVAVLAKVFGLGYILGRLISIVGFLSALTFGYVFCRREGGSRATALAAMAIVAGAFAPCGAWYDLARPDSLFLGLVTGGLIVGYSKRESHLGVAIAAALMVAAFFTKQTASPFMVALGIVLLVVHFRTLPTYVATLAALGLPLLWLLNHQSDGWFWTYVFKLHQRHDFYPVRAFVGTPAQLIAIIGPALLTIPWALARRRSSGLWFATFIGLTGTAAACLGFGTQWAFTNAFIPGVFFLSIAIGTASGRLVSRIDMGKGEAPPRLRGAVVYVLLAISIALAPGALLSPLKQYAPKSWGEPDVVEGYHSNLFVPTPADRKNGDALIARLRAAPGQVMVPFHPFYSYLAGHDPKVHRMGVVDIGRANMGAPRGLADAISRQEFSLIVMDDKIDGNWQMWPGLLDHYAITDHIVGPRAVSGAMTQPKYVLTPTAPTDSLANPELQ